MLVYVVSLLCCNFWCAILPQWMTGTHTLRAAWCMLLPAQEVSTYKTKVIVVLCCSIKLNACIVVCGPSRFYTHWILIIKSQRIGKYYDLDHFTFFILWTHRKTRGRQGEKCIFPFVLLFRSKCKYFTFKFVHKPGKVIRSRNILSYVAVNDLNTLHSCKDNLLYVDTYLEEILHVWIE